MTEKKVTIPSLLAEDKRKYIAEKLLSNDISEMVIIYREGDDFQCGSTEMALATTIGMLEMAKNFIMNDWLNPEIYENGDQDDKLVS